MSTAIMHQSSLYEFGDLYLKNQSVCAATQATAEHLSLSRARSLGGPVRDLRQALAERAAVDLSALHRRLERAASEPAGAQSPSAAPSQAQPQPPPNASRYKTELCRPYEEAGSCKYGDKCQFAHGMRELRNLQRHPKYKTELCRTFHSVGFCPYGPRCHFVHNADEARQRPSLPPSPGGSGSGSGPGSASGHSRSPAGSVAFFPPSPSPPASPRTSPPPSPEEGRLPVFNRLMSLGDLAIA